MTRRYRLAWPLSLSLSLGLFYLPRVLLLPYHEQKEEINKFGIYCTYLSPALPHGLHFGCCFNTPSYNTCHCDRILKYIYFSHSISQSLNLYVCKCCA